MGSRENIENTLLPYSLKPPLFRGNVEKKLSKEARSADTRDVDIKSLVFKQGFPYSLFPTPYSLVKPTKPISHTLSILIL